MEEKNNGTPNEPVNNRKSEKQIETKKESAKKKSSFSTTVAEYKADFKKIIWPGRDELTKKTATVLVTSLVVGIIIFCMDTVFHGGNDLLWHFLQR